MTQHFSKHQLAKSACMPFPLSLMIKLSDLEEATMHMAAHPSHKGEVRVKDGDGLQLVINLQPEWKCTFGDFRDFRLLYVHA